MTHDELLAKIDEKQKLWWAILAEVNYPKKEREDFWVISALRAVVELHKPRTYRNKFTGEKELYCPQCAIESGVPIDTYLMPQAYPCPTIQAIEKELS